jgi:hypothetical protein
MLWNVEEKYKHKKALPKPARLIINKSMRKL